LYSSLEPEPKLQALAPVPPSKTFLAPDPAIQNCMGSGSTVPAEMHACLGEQQAIASHEVSKVLKYRYRHYFSQKLYQLIYKCYIQQGCQRNHKERIIHSLCVAGTCKLYVKLL